MHGNGRAINAIHRRLAVRVFRDRIWF